MALSAAYRVEIGKADAEVWALAVRKVSGPDLLDATEQWIKHSPKLPRPAEILQTASIIARRRQATTPALPAPHDPERQREINRRGMAMVKNQLRQGRLRVGQRLDDVLAEEPEA